MHWDEQRLGRWLKLRDIHVLLTVAKCGSMGKAAEELSVSQPAISKVISDLEYALGVPLLDRNPRGVEPTIYARAILDRGVAIFDELKQAVKHVEFLANPTAGELRIGSTIAIAAGFIPTAIDRLSRRYPQIVFHLSAGEASTTYRALDERTVDLVVSPIFGPIDEQIQGEVLYSEPLVVVAGARSPWARRRRIELGGGTSPGRYRPKRACMAPSWSKRFEPPASTCRARQSSRPSLRCAMLSSRPDDT